MRHDDIVDIALARGDVGVCEIVLIHLGMRGNLFLVVKILAEDDLGFSIS